jgi:hypothetical protein
MSLVLCTTLYSGCTSVAAAAPVQGPAAEPVWRKLQTQLHSPVTVNLTSLEAIMAHFADATSSGTAGGSGTG